MTSRGMIYTSKKLYQAVISTLKSLPTYSGRINDTIAICFLYRVPFIVTSMEEWMNEPRTLTLFFVTPQLCPAPGPITTISRHIMEDQQMCNCTELHLPFFSFFPWYDDHKKLELVGTSEIICSFILINLEILSRVGFTAYLNISSGGTVTNP